MNTDLKVPGGNDCKKLQVLLKKIKVSFEKEVYNHKDSFGRPCEAEVVDRHVNDMCYVSECIGQVLSLTQLIKTEKTRLNHLWKIYNNWINADLNDIVRHMEKNEKIQGIKKMRALFNSGLKDAKDLYEEIVEMHCGPDKITKRKEFLFEAWCEIK